MNQLGIASVFIVLWFTAVPSFAVNHAGSNAEAIKVAQAPGSMTDGEVLKVDKDSKKITIKHGPIHNLDMPAMTMVFQVKDASMLDQVRTGDKLKFTVEKSSGGYVVTHMNIAK